MSATDAATTAQKPVGDRLFMADCRDDDCPLAPIGLDWLGDPACPEHIGTIVAGVISDARATIASILERHGITDPAQAHRLLEERCTDDELATWKKALEALDASGAID